ncbi:hypothetical protein [Niabella beijingensis]|uniref:hypothetical protein n=1 Tax=Niabella beijingensis TaxID=2872700 RepID=UPI001CBAB31E|nr:hypothetical protein [Niabella beijingensis]MBZ4192308.1 hypothetical protein [Niabella beijingensis]
MATVSATVMIINTKSGTVSLQLQRNIADKMTTPSVKFSSSLPVNNQAINKGQEVDFELDVKSGEQKKMTYSYKVYVRE